MTTNSGHGTDENAVYYDTFNGDLVQTIAGKDIAANLEAVDRAVSVESSAWLASYGTLPTAPANRFTLLALDDFMQINAASMTGYTTPVLDGLLGMFDQVAIQIATDDLSFTAPSNITLTAQIEHSADGRNWINKNAAAEVTGPLDPQGLTAMEPGYDPGTTPSLGYVRIRVVVSGTNTPAPMKVRVKMYVTCNDYREKQFTTIVQQRQQLWEQEFGGLARAESVQLVSLKSMSGGDGGGATAC